MKTARPVQQRSGLFPKYTVTTPISAIDHAGRHKWFNGRLKPSRLYLPNAIMTLKKRSLNRFATKLSVPPGVLFSFSNDPKCKGTTPPCSCHREQGEGFSCMPHHRPTENRHFYWEWTGQESIVQLSSFLYGSCLRVKKVPPTKKTCAHDNKAHPPFTTGSFR